MRKTHRKERENAGNKYKDNYPKIPNREIPGTKKQSQKKPTEKSNKASEAKRKSEKKTIDDDLRRISQVTNINKN